MFENTLIRASAMGVLFTQPQSKEAKDKGELSATAKAFLIKIYVEEYWGRTKDISTVEMQKGTYTECDVRNILSELDGVKYEKNELRGLNEWSSGCADIVTGDEIIDIKSSFSADTFIPKILEPIDKMYNIQLQTYMWLYNKPKARLVYGLVSAPDMIIQNELKRLLYNMDVISDVSPEYIEAAQELTKNMVFDDIPKSERIISLPIARDEEIISQMPQKVTKAREYLNQLHEIHINLNKK